MELLSPPGGRGLPTMVRRITGAIKRSSRDRVGLTNANECCLATKTLAVVLAEAEEVP